jgi:hypothetical protein
MTDSDLPSTFDPDAADDLASWPVTSDTAAAPVVCPWCSATLPAPDGETCPSCGANLAAEEEVQVPGVTALDPMTALRTRSPSRPRPRRDVLGWITGESELTPTYDDPVAVIAPTMRPHGAASLPAAATVPPSPDALAPPDARVRREMLRMELAAIGLELPEAEAPGVDAEAGVDAGVDADADGAGASGPPSALTGSDARDASGSPGA